MARGICKKIFLLANKESKPLPLIAKEISRQLREKDLLGDEVKAVIKEMVLSSSKKTKAPLSNLFDIKSLNQIEDKMTRGLAKKVYIAGKKANKNSKEVINEILNALESNDKMSDDIRNLLNELA